MKRKSRIKITLSEQDISKFEEIEILDDLRVFFKERDCYLTSLFTQDFVNWAKRSIADDFPIDIYQNLIEVQRRTNAEGTEAARKIEELEKKVKGVESNVEVLIKVRDDLLARNRELKEEYDGAQMEARQVENNLSRIQQIIEDRDLEIIKLKARLYDLTVEEHK